MKPSTLATTTLITPLLVLAECGPGEVSLVFLGGVRNQEFCHASGSCSKQATLDLFPVDQEPAAAANAARAISQHAARPRRLVGEGGAD
jgi:hypothetical protein